MGSGGGGRNGGLRLGFPGMLILTARPSLLAKDVVRDGNVTRRRLERHAVEAHDGRRHDRLARWCWCGGGSAAASSSLLLLGLAWVLGAAARPLLLCLGVHSLWRLLCETYPFLADRVACHLLLHALSAREEQHLRQRSGALTALIGCEDWLLRRLVHV